jgi:hypothetical protein
MNVHNPFRRGADAFHPLYGVLLYRNYAQFRTTSGRSPG